MIKPNYEDFKKLCSQGNLIPLATEMPGDLDTPLSALLKIDDSQSSFLLESVEGGERWARYSFLGSDPRAIIKSNHGTVPSRARFRPARILRRSRRLLLIRCCAGF